MNQDGKDNLSTRDKQWKFHCLNCDEILHPLYLNEHEKMLTCGSKMVYIYINILVSFSIRF